MARSPVSTVRTAAASSATVARASRNATPVRTSSRTPVTAKAPRSAGTSSAPTNSLPSGTTKASAAISAGASPVVDRDDGVTGGFRRHAHGDRRDAHGARRAVPVVLIPA